VDELKRDLKQRNVKLVLAGRRTDLKRWFSANRAKGEEKGLLFVSDLYLALKLIQSSECVNCEPSPAGEKRILALEDKTAMGQMSEKQ
jgi:hypothetical protein